MTCRNPHGIHIVDMWGWSLRWLTRLLTRTDSDGCGAMGPRGDDKQRRNSDVTSSGERRWFWGREAARKKERTMVNSPSLALRPMDDGDDRQRGRTGGGTAGFGEDGAPMVD